MSVTFYDMQGALVDLSFDYKITSFEQGEPYAWPRLIAEYINVHVPLVSAGRMTEQGLLIAYRNNKIFALETSGICKATIDFHCIAKYNDSKDLRSEQYDFVYPENIDAYCAGVKVLQPKTGLIYQCRPWPFNEFCRVKDDDNQIFEPGIGQSWAMAWQKVSG